jgi:hypothetical protein
MLCPPDVTVKAGRKVELGRGKAQPLILRLPKDERRIDIPAVEA